METVTLRAKNLRKYRNYLSATTPIAYAIPPALQFRKAHLPVITGAPKGPDGARRIGNTTHLNSPNRFSEIPTIVLSLRANSPNVEYWGAGAYVEGGPGETAGRPGGLLVQGIRS